MSKKTKDEKHIEALLESSLANLKPASTIPTLIKAIERNDFDSVRTLISQGEDPCMMVGSTFPLFTATAYNHIHIMELLLSLGANVNQFTPDLKWTPLINAAYWGHIEACNTLLKNHADYNHTSHHGYTALDIAKVNAHQEVIKILKKLPYIK